MMKIVEEIYRQMIKLPKVPPEMGGIIGTKDGNVIDHIIFDNGVYGGNCNVYIPDIDYLNLIITEWFQKGIVFQGIFHTHTPQCPSLSNDDKTYIKEIFATMPSKLETLFFPLVIPGKCIKAYKACRYEGVVDIYVDDIEKIKK